MRIELEIDVSTPIGMKKFKDIMAMGEPMKIYPETVHVKPKVTTKPKPSPKKKKAKIKPVKKPEPKSETMPEFKLKVPPIHPDGMVTDNGPKSN